MGTTKPVLIFDFDGTIADTTETIFEIVNEMAKGLGYRQIREDELAHFRTLGTEEMIDKLGIRQEVIPALLTGIHQGLAARTESLKPVKGMPEVITHFAHKGYNMLIVTTNTEANVRGFLGKYKISGFDRIYPESGLAGKSTLLDRAIKELKVMPERVVFIGDETRDIEAGKKSGVKTVAVCWGLNGKAALAAKQPDWIADKPEELEAVILTTHG